MVESAPQGSERWRHFVRRVLPRGLLLLGLAFLLLHHFRARPSSVEVVFEYGRAARGLVAARMVYWQGSDEMHRVQFDYRGQPAGSTQRHQVRLHEGDYSVEAQLTYAGRPPEGLPRERSPSAGGAVRIVIHRPLLVRGGGELHVYLAPERE